jgi:hypothetical protein
MSAELIPEEIERGVEEVCKLGRTEQHGVTTFSGMLFVASTVSEMQEAIKLFGREVIPNFP